MAFPERVFGILEVARVLGVHPGSLRRAEREGRIPAARREPLSRYRFYTAEDVAVLKRVFTRTESGWPP